MGNKDAEYLALGDGTKRLNRNVGYWNLRCVTSQKSEELIYAAAED